MRKQSPGPHKLYQKTNPKTNDETKLEDSPKLEPEVVRKKGNNRTSTYEEWAALEAEDIRMRLISGRRRRL